MPFPLRCTWRSVTASANRLGSGQLATRSYSPAGIDFHSTDVVSASCAQILSRQTGGMDVFTALFGTSVSTRSGAARLVTTRSDDPGCNLTGGSCGPISGLHGTQADSYPGASTSK